MSFACLVLGSSHSIIDPARFGFFPSFSRLQQRFFRLPTLPYPYPSRQPASDESLSCLSQECCRRAHTRFFLAFIYFLFSLSPFFLLGLDFLALCPVIPHFAFCILHFATVNGVTRFRHALQPTPPGPHSSVRRTTASTGASLDFRASVQALL